MTTDRARKQAVRARMEQTGEPYAVAARHLDAAPGPAPAETVQAVLDEDIPTQERGIAALPADATPAQRARAEALWRPQTDPAQPCRCSGTACHHGEPCEESDDGEAACSGRLIHVDRYPGSFFSRTVWEDAYVCSETETGCTSAVEQPELPWGEPREGGGVVIYDDVRHPNFPETHPGYQEPAEYPSGNGVCQCGGYAFTGLLCDSCRIEGWTDHYGEITEPDPDDYDDEDYDEEAEPPPAPTPLCDQTRPQVGTACDQGPRPSQCDAAAVHHQDNGAWAAAVIDGYGPHPDVPVAARRAAEAAVEAGARYGARGGLLAAGRTLTRTDAEGWPEPDCVGAVVACDLHGELTAAWTGDVRVYTLHDLGSDRTLLYQQSADHTEGQRMRDAAAAGEPLTEDPAEHDHVVTTTLGQLPSGAVEMDSTTLPDRCAGVLITSDGVHDALTHAQLTHLVATTPDPDECAAALVAAARAADADRDEDQAVADNATALLLRFPAHEDQEAAEQQRRRRILMRAQFEDMEALRHRDQDVHQARGHLHRSGYGSGEEAGDAAAVAAVRDAARERPEQVTETDRAAARRLAAAVDRAQRREERAQAQEQ